MTRVVQIDPAPMPTLTASTPSSISASVPSAVATLPATRSTSGKPPAQLRAPCRARPASGRARCRRRGRRRSRRPARRRAPACRARRRPPRRSAAGRASPSTRSGYLTAFWMSLTVISPFSRKSRSTTSSFSTLCWCRISRAASSVVPTGTVNSGSRVITSAIGRLTLVSKRRSRLVRMPTSRPSLLPSSVIGTPEMLYFFIRSSAS